MFNLVHTFTLGVKDQTKIYKEWSLGDPKGRSFTSVGQNIVGSWTSKVYINSRTHPHAHLDSRDPLGSRSVSRPGAEQSQTRPAHGTTPVRTAEELTADGVVVPGGGSDSGAAERTGSPMECIAIETP